jgi:cytochrome c5
MAEQNHNFSLTLTSVFLLMSIFILGCSDDNVEAKKKSAEPARDTMPKLNVAEAPAEQAPAEQPVVKEEAAKTSAAEEPPTETTPPAAVQPVPAGEKVYKSGCIACHATGVAGAPKFGDAALWKDRIAKGKDVLVKNAITGYTGTSGVMPPKGGLAHLSDEDIAAAVEYMMQAAQ